MAEAGAAVPGDPDVLRVRAAVPQPLRRAQQRVGRHPAGRRHRRDDPAHGAPLLLARPAAVLETSGADSTGLPTTVLRRRRGLRRPAERAQGFCPACLQVRVVGERPEEGFAGRQSLEVTVRSAQGIDPLARKGEVLRRPRDEPRVERHGLGRAGRVARGPEPGRAGLPGSPAASRAGDRKRRAPPRSDRARTGSRPPSPRCGSRARRDPPCGRTTRGPPRSGTAAGDRCRGSTARRPAAGRLRPLRRTAAEPRQGPRPPPSRAPALRAPARAPRRARAPGGEGSIAGVSRPRPSSHGSRSGRPGTAAGTLSRPRGGRACSRCRL